MNEFNPTGIPAKHPLHHVIDALHTERGVMLRSLERETLRGMPTELICNTIRDNRAATRAILWFLNDEVMTQPAPL